MCHALRSCDSTTGRVDTQHDSLYLFVLHGIVEGFHNVVAVYAAPSALVLAGHHLAFSVNDGNAFLSGFLAHILSIALGFHQSGCTVAGFQFCLDVLFKA